MSDLPPTNPAPVPEPSEIETKLTRLMREHVLEIGPGFEIDSNLFKAGLDSMGIMQLLILIENHFSLVLGEVDISKVNFVSIRSLAAIIHMRLEMAREK